jgi:hypothetical protein
LIRLEAQRPGPPPDGPPGDFRGLRAIENTWAAMAFDLNADTATIEKARPHFQKAWSERQQVMREAGGDLSRVSAGMARIAAELNENLKSVLPAEQVQRLSLAEADRLPPPANGPRPGFGPSAPARRPAQPTERRSLPKSNSERRVLAVVDEMGAKGGIRMGVPTRMASYSGF